MLDKLIDFLLSILDQLTPWVVIPEYDKGVRLRLGKRRGVLEPGLHYKIPFVDEVLTHMVVPTTLNLEEQSITTLDNRSIVLKGVLKYEVHDVERLLLSVGSASDALADMCGGIIRDKVIERPWGECNTPALVTDISRAVKSEARKWGITILTITLTDLAEMRSIRLLNK